MAGPYFRNQMSYNCCGCYWPDVTRLRDVEGNRTEIVYCVLHKDMLGVNVEEAPDVKVTIPDDAWREEQRQKLRSAPNGIPS